MATRGFEDIDLKNVDKDVAQLNKQIADIRNYLEIGTVPGQAPTAIAGFGRVNTPIPVFSPERQRVLDALADLEQRLAAQVAKGRTIAQSWNASLGPNEKRPKLLTKYLPSGAPTGATSRQTAAATVTETTPTVGQQEETLVVSPTATTGGAGVSGPTTGATGTTGAGQRRGGRRKPPVATDEQIAEAVQQFFPNVSAEWLSENGVAHFGQDLIDLFRRVAAPGSTFDVTTEDGKERIRAEIRKTVYWQTTTTAAKNFDQLAEVDRVNTLERTKQRLAATYGDLGLDQTTLNELSQLVARNGLTGLGEQQAIYNAVFRVAAQRPSQAQRALEGADADRIRSLGRAYNFDVTNEQIQSILTGTPETATGLVLTEDGLRERMQKAVKGAMPQLADQIDAGLTLDDISRNYKRYAAQLLERDENEINMFEGPYLDAFGNKDQGQLSLGEWTQKVKSDPRFGWQFTNQANRQASDIALTIARAFGKVQ